MSLDLVEQAERRARLAGLLGRLLLQEPGPDVAPLVAGIDELEPLGRPAPDLAADFERLLLREVPVFESVFLGDDGQRGGPVVAEVVEWYRRHDFDEATRWRVPSPDQLGLELRFLAHLAVAEGAAWGDERPDEATRLVEAEREFLALHLGQWGEVAAAALRRRAGEGPYAALASAVGDLLAGEAERLRPAPDHPGMGDVAAAQPPGHLGPARIARWLLAPGRSGAFLDVDDLADASLSIGVPWRPSDGRSAFRHVVEAAVDGGDLDRLLARLRPAVAAWRDAHQARELERDADRRIWTWWRSQAELTLALIDRLSAAAGGAGPTSAPGPVVVVIRGPGHHDRAAAAAAVVAAVADVGRVAVSADLRPRLADDVSALLAAGATEVLLAGDGLSAVAVADGGAAPDRERRGLPDADVVVRLVAGPGPMSAEVVGGGDRADRVRERLAGVPLTAGARRTR